MRRTTIISTALAMLLLAGALPAAAAPPEQEQRPLTQTAPDPFNGLQIFWNTTRELRCEWEEQGQQLPLPGIETVTATRIETGQGAVVYRFRETAPLELWPTDAGGGFSACSASEEADAPYAVGTGTFTLVSNDSEPGEPPSGTRTAVTNRRLEATVEDAQGQLWDYSFRSVEVVDRDGNGKYPVYRATLRKKDT